MPALRARRGSSARTQLVAIALVVAHRQGARPVEDAEEGEVANAGRAAACGLVGAPRDSREAT